MTNTTVSAPTFRIQFGTANQPPVHETWMDRCEEFGCRCIPNEQDHYDDVTSLAVHTGSAVSYLEALLDAISLLRAHEATGWVAMVNVGDGTGQSFCASGWSTISEQIDYLTTVVRHA